jgi:hypothetical protein
MGRALVIGNGAAGTFSSWLLARKGWKVILAGRGAPGTSMSTGCLRTSPNICPAEITEFLSNEDMPWTTGEREGISKIGTSFRCWMSPSHSTWGEGKAPESIAVVGLEGHPSLQARVAAAMLSKRGIRAMPFIIPSSLPSDVPLASSFRNDQAWEALAEELERTSSEAVLLPAIVPLKYYGRLERLEDRAGRRILEAISPLGAPGQRLADLMLAKAKAEGVVVWDGRKIAALDVREGTVRGATVLGGMEVRDIAFDALVVATGGPLVDGLELDERTVKDPYHKFQVVRQDDALRGGYDSSNGMLIAVNGQVMTNAAGAGDCLSSERREYGSGLTEALESAYLAVRALEAA